METIYQSLNRILLRCKAGKSAALDFEADGTEYIRNFRPKERLILLGGGHISQALAGFAAQLDFSVWVADDRPAFANHTLFACADEVICDAFPDAIKKIDIREGDYVSVLTRGHRWDAECLRLILPDSHSKYLGMIGSKRRVSGLLKLLEEEGFDREVLAAIHSPIGLSIGALTPEEIAISILAELIQCRRQDTYQHKKSSVLICEDTDLSLLEFLAQEPTPKALLVVYETHGSTPVKAGAVMAVDQNGRTIGTIGGGCGEHSVMMKAYSLIGTGGRCCMTVDMSNDIAEEEGMVCGGQMRVLVEDILYPSYGNKIGQDERPWEIC